MARHYLIAYLFQANTADGVGEAYLGGHSGTQGRYTGSLTGFASLRKEVRSDVSLGAEF